MASKPLGAGLRYLTPEQVADVLAVNQQTVRKWLREGRLRGQRVGRLWRVPISAAEEIGEMGSVTNRAGER